MFVCAEEVGSVMAERTSFHGVFVVTLLAVMLLPGELTSDLIIRPQFIQSVSPCSAAAIKGCRCYRLSDNCFNDL